MTPEEFQRIKEAEKEHLRALKKLKAQLRDVERKKSVSQALENMIKAPGDDILSTHEEMIDRLAMDTIQQEARLEVALSDAGELDPGDAGNPVERARDEQRDQDKLDQDKSDSGKLAEPDAELQKVKAQDLVRQIKIQMGLPTERRKQEPSENVTHKDSTDAGAPEGKEPDSSQNPVRPNQTTLESLPEKTIGRIPKKKP